MIAATASARNTNISPCTDRSKQRGCTA
jgi:hypothetical protein